MVLRKEHRPDDLTMKIRLLIEKNCEFFGIKKQLESENEWSIAVLELVKFPKQVLPSAKLQCLVNTARYIYQEVKLTYNKDVTGDQLLPIVIFVVVKASDINGKKIVITE